MGDEKYNDLAQPPREPNQYWSVELTPELWPLYQEFLQKLHTSDCFWHLRGISHERGDMIDVQGFGDETYHQLAEWFSDQAEALMEEIHARK